ncbi:otoferlin [Musca vetustissima]|uniref:otoferlin n=1 Tax=Musca vetustissima TaxID=27455 RepID=UPI002AB6FA3C|nr:otoferlin [Musca vetustissima]
MLPSQENCFLNVPQDFLICTTIHKARQLGIFQSEIYVRVSLNKTTRHTKVFANSENPYFNEYFVFELKCTLVELLRLTIRYEVKRRTPCRKDTTLGELLVDMQSVWHQGNRCYFKKWGRLEAAIEGEGSQREGKSENHGDGPRGYLQIDLAIVSQATNPQTLLRPGEEDGEDMQSVTTNVWQINQDYDNIEKNLLDNVEAEVRCNILYSVIFYRGIMAKKSDYFLQFRFHPFKGKTSLAKNTQYPVWNQEAHFAWIYPSLSQTLLLQLMAQEQLQWKCLAEYEIHFQDIAFKDKPFLGPCFIHFYDSLIPTKYIGRLLFEIRSECLESPPITRNLNIKSIPPLDESRHWQEESFLVEFLLLQGEFMHGNVSNCKIQMKMAEASSNSVECFLKPYPAKKGPKIAKPLKYFQQESPYKTITMRLQLPDYRHKDKSAKFFQELKDIIQQELDKFHQFQVLYGEHRQAQLKILRYICTRLLYFIKTSVDSHRLEYRGPKEPTQWDVRCLSYMQDYLLKFSEDLRNLRSTLKPADDKVMEQSIEKVLQDLSKYIIDLQNLLSVTCLQDKWPDLVLILHAGNKECGFCRLNPKSFIFAESQWEEEGSWNQCWKVRNFVFKDSHCHHTCRQCGCIAGILLGCLSITTEREHSLLLNKIKQEWSNPEPFYYRPLKAFTRYNCRIFIHQAKIRPGSDRNGLCDPYVRIMFGPHAAETPILFTTLSPIWNAVITLNNVTLPGPIEWYGNTNSPLLAIELYDTDRRTADDYLGCGILPVTVIAAERHQDLENKMDGHKHALEKYMALQNLSPPPLRWLPISLNGTIRAEILISAELVEAANEEDADSLELALVTVGIPAAIRPTMKNYVLEVIFAGLRNYTKTSVFSGRHRVKLMMADLLLVSGLSTARLGNSFNFLISYASGVVSLPEQLEYWPAIIATDVVISAKEQETTVGAVLISNAKRYLELHKDIKCVPREDDDELSNAETNTTLHLTTDVESESMPLLKKSPKKSPWRGIFHKKSPQKITGEPQNLEDERQFNWWTKFYNSINVEESCSAVSRFKHRLCIYPNELEKQSEFSYLRDWSETFQLVHGVRSNNNPLTKEEIYATLKMKIKVTACQCRGGGMERLEGYLLKPLATALNPRYQMQLQSLADLVKVVVRVYVVQGLQLRPGEKHAQADAYVRVQWGRTQISNRAEFVPNESNPIFGKCFQLEGLLPREHILDVSIFNRHSLRDEPIGSTSIDLEDRWRSRHRATVGIANEFSSIGYNKWRDSQTPREILEDLCKKNDIKLPRYKDNRIEVDGVSFEDETILALDEDPRERLALTALKNLQTLPSFGYKLIPEHVETRSLYRSECPGIEQGKIQLWLELFDGNLNLPPVIDITPQPPELFELRLVIFSVSDVVLDERNIFGNAMSDIYVKGWCSNPDQAQTTDIHYRSLNGEGKFNWRMIFPLKYSSIEDRMLVKRKTGLMEEYHSKQPPKLYLQIWDDDIISQDDFLGSLEINLSNFPQPFETAKKCQLITEENRIDITQRGAKACAAGGVKFVNLFREKKIRGWFPVRGNIPDMGNKLGMAGKIEMELELLTEKEAALYPAGLGRNPPNALPEPRRPPTSFNPLTNPWKGLKRIIAPNFLKYFLILGLLALLGFLIFLFVMNLPLLLEQWTY